MAKKLKEEQPDEKTGRFGQTAVLGRWCCRMTPMLCLFIMAGTGMHALWVQALSDPAFVVSAEAVTLARSGNEGCDISSVGQAIEGANLLNPDALGRFRHALEKNAWIDRVTACRRVLPNRVQVDFSIRKPFAQICRKGLYYRVTRDGVALPGSGGDASQAFNGLPVVFADEIPLPRDGGIWESHAVRDALDVLDMIHHSPLSARLQIASVQAWRNKYVTPTLQSKETRPSLKLVTREGAIIEWGESVQTASDRGTLMNTEKLDLLRRALEFSPSMERGNVWNVSTRTMTCSGRLP